MKDNSVNDFVRPAGWGLMGLLGRMRWLVAEGHAEDDLAAVGLLRELGDFPSEEELGMCNGRAISERAPRRRPVTDRRTTTRHHEARGEAVPAVCRGAVGRSLWD